MKVQPRVSQPLAQPAAPQAPVSAAKAPSAHTDHFVDTGREGGTGALGEADPNVATARTVASEHARDRVFGEGVDRAEILNHLGQIDSGTGNEAGGNDAIRCSAASLVAGNVLMGPESTASAMERVEGRGRALLQQYEELRTDVGETEGTDSAAYRELSSHIDELRASQDTLASLRAIPSGDLRVEDLHRFQEALYTQALFDQRLQSTDTGDVYTTIDGDMLTTGTMQTYRDVMWGEGVRPEMNGRSLDAFYVNNESGGGHFVLADETAGADGGRSIGFNPWPDDDGTAFSRAADGEGARVVPESGTYVEGSQLRGLDVDADGRRLPERVFLE
ncbi:MAG: hypothetical protein JNK82_05600 [Myxococcaceae bacterium]|nr:hypothetical protein [Myxococcaceae bacterium]